MSIHTQKYDYHKIFENQKKFHKAKQNIEQQFITLSQTHEDFLCFFYRNAFIFAIHYTKPDMANLMDHRKQIPK